MPHPAPRDESRQRIFIGDIQGCADELDDLLEVIRFDPTAHRLIAVGDLVNRGPASARVLRRLIALDADSVLGNHDLHLLAHAAGRRPRRPDDTFDDVLQAPDAPPLLDWLRQRPLVLGWPDVVVVHAGLHPAWRDPEAIARPLEARIRAGELPLGDAALQFLTRVRFCNAEGTRPTDEQSPGPGFAPWDDHYRGRRTVVFGHWAQRGLVHGERVRGLDTGCVWGGRLTAWIAAEDRFVSVAARRRYCEFL
jgi:bis(5'-nucleosyl)-tetraphosphatase (symmetrical)